MGIVRFAGAETFEKEKELILTKFLENTATKGLKIQSQI